MKKHKKNHFWYIALFTRFNLHMLAHSPSCIYGRYDASGKEPTSESAHANNFNFGGFLYVLKVTLK